VRRPEPEDWPDFPALLKRHGIRSDKRLGQHFLFDAGALGRVAAAAGLGAGETALEVGAGVGSLTLALSYAAKRVVAVEVDRRLLPALREAVARRTNVEIVVGDVLALDLAALVGGSPYVVVANIPYNITSHLIRRLLEAPVRAERLVLTVQEEVARRVSASAGEMSLLALSVRLYGAPRIDGRIPPGAFHPPPRVESAILVIDVHREPRLSAERIEPFFALARAGFHEKRKKLRNSLARGLDVEPGAVARWLEAAALPPACRAEDLALEDWDRLLRAAEARGLRGP
jgi:16S rRNA (adenine1518-N6/adenine1519-N6)-dimethyltransferase